MLACGLWIAFLLGCYLRIWGDTGSAAYSNISLALPGSIWGTQLGRNVFSFILAQLTIHVLAATACFVLGVLTHSALKATKQTPLTWTMLWSIATMAWTLLANATWFPATSLGSVYAPWAALNWQGISPLHLVSTLLACAAAASFVRILSRLLSRTFVPRLRFALPLLSLALLTATFAIPKPAVSRATTARPNVIIIGLDSLRPDAISAHTMPSLHAFMGSATAFPDTTTPLARTFPSWVTLLTGRHPHTTGATTNLWPRELINTGDTLPFMFSRAGYQSIYAIDEVRFSNLDTSYGFDRMIAPPMGATDFALGFFADAPLMNVLVNTAVGRFLFPFTHANRAAAATYDPDAFVRLIDAGLPDQGPLFVATHFTLCHWPFTWAGEPPLEKGPAPVASAYARANARVDRQFADFMRVLAHRGILSNAVVVVLSDHGESLGGTSHPHAAEWASFDSLLDTTNVLGHGSSILAQEQYQVLLAIKRFGSAAETDWPQSINVPASLEDVAPTLVELFALKTTDQFDGHSLLPLIKGIAPPAAFANRIRFTETEFNPTAAAPVSGIDSMLNKREFRDALGYYTIDPDTDRITFKRQALHRVMAKRQYAAFRKDSLLIAYSPLDSAEDALKFAYAANSHVSPETIRPTDLAANTDAGALWQAMNRRFPGFKDRMWAGAWPDMAHPQQTMIEAVTQTPTSR